jgi:hypothetical protein
MTNGCTVDSAIVQQLPPDYIVNNQLSVKNFREYDLYSDYLADVRGHDCNNDGNGSSDQPVPEPGTMMMFGTALLGFAGFEIRRRKTS